MRSTTLVLLVLVCGCRASDNYRIHPHAFWAVDDKCVADAAGDPDYVIVADTHASFPLAPHEMVSNTFVTDAVGHAAVRPPHVDLWSDRVLEWIVRHRANAKRLVHLGDAANIACVAEFQRFLDNVDVDPKISWVFTPGNHDSLVMGNFADYVVDDHAETKWGRECGQLPVLTKTRLLQMYLDAKKWTFDPDSATSKAANFPVDGNRRCAVVEGGDDSTITAVRCDVYTHDEHGKPVPDESSAFYSFIVQLVADDKQDLLLLDSTDFRKLPRYPQRPGGIYGGISDLQLTAATWLIAQRKAKQHPILIGTHYPIDALDADSLHALERFLGEQNVVAVVTAHAHNPTAGRRHSTAEGKDFLEVNVGSVAGWPMEYQTFSLDMSAHDEITLTTRVVSVARALLQARADLGVAPSESCAVALTTEKVSPRNYNFYKNYYRDHGYLKLVRAMYADLDAFLRANNLSAYHGEEELAGLAPKRIAPKMPDDQLAEIMRYERCQAVFASAAESGVDLDAPAPDGDSTQCDASFLSKREDPAPERCESRVLREGDAVQTRTWRLTSKR